MKRSAIIGCLLILNIAFSQAVFLKKPNTQQFAVFSQLQKVEQHSFGKRILDTIALQITNRVPLAEVAKIISEIKGNLKAQQAVAENLNAERTQECNSEDERLTNIINDNTAIQSDAQENISVLDVEISELTASISNKDRQLELLADRVSSLTVARQRDADAYATRVAETQQVVEALNLIVEKVSGIAPESSEKEVFVQLAKIGKSNPILSLVSIASTFSPESLSKVIGKLSELRDSLVVSLSEDESAEQHAISDYHALSGELSSNISSLTILRGSLQNELYQKQASHAFHTSRFNNALETIHSNTELLERKRSQCTDWSQTYTSETESRNKEISIVDEVQNIIATKLETMKDYLKERAEQ